MATPPSKTSLSADRQALLAKLLAGKAKLDAPAQAAIPPRPPASEMPLSYAQQRLWFLWQLEPDNPFYNMPLALRLKGHLDVEVLRRTLDEIVRRHESLRTTFALEDGQPVQRIAPAVSLDLDVIDLSGPGAEADAKRLAREEALRPFDLARELPIRARVLRLAADDQVVLFTLHHIVSDVWSMGVLTREVVALYAAFIEGKPSPLPPLPIQYADFAHWQRQWLSGEVLERQLDYWRTQLAEVPTLLALPTDRPRPPVQAHRGAHHVFDIEPELTQALRDLGQRADATLYMVLLAGFSLLLSRYSGQQDICIGSPIANRNRAETEPLIGFFVNTLVMRTRLDDNPSVMDLLARAREVAMGAYAHQDLPFEQLLEVLKPERNLSHAPLFQVSLALQNAPQGRLALPGLTLEAGEGGTHGAKFDLTLFVNEAPDGLAAYFEYDTDLFEAATMARMAGHLKALLRAMCETPERTVAELPMLSSEERARLASWNATAAPFDERPVHTQFEVWAQRAPEAIAVLFENSALSYAELDARANRLAHELIARGIGADQFVGVCMERAPEMIVALLGILKAGAAYVPLDPYYPPERLAYMLEDSGLRLVLTQEHLRERLAPHADCIVPTAESFADRPATAPAIAVLPDQLAYLIYTSGSTGRPKGTAVPHRGLSNFREAEARKFRLHEGSRFLQFSSLSFDATVFEIFVTLTEGATLCMAQQDQLRSVPDLIALMRRHAINITLLPPSLLALFPPDTELPALETLITGGDACNPALARHWSRGRRFINAYGPTEASVCVAWYECRDFDGDVLPIGKPLPNVALHLLDERLQPVPVGVAGELYIGGIGLARGYLGRPGLTAERFLPDPFSAVPGARMYRSGDKARLLDDGNIEFLGRVDQQVKIRGFRIELGEIENALRDSAQVRDCLVDAWTEGNDKRLVAHVVPASADVSPASLRTALADRLPEYMLPSAFVLLEAFPLNANGKLDRKALPPPDFAAQRAPRVAPRNETERRLATLWAEVLKQDEVGVHDRFFEVGGHSLLATQLISRIRQAFQVELPLRAIFEGPSIAQLAERLAEQQHGQQRNDTAPPLVPVARDRAMPLSYAQQRLWFLWQLEPENPFYNLPLALRLKGRLDVAVLGRTLDEIVRRHESLRTRFTLEGGQPVQRIEPAQTLSMQVLEPESEVEAHRLAREEALRPFDLADDLPIRVRVLRLAAEDHLVLFTLHHIVSDVWSMGVLTREVVALYAAFLEGRPSPLPELPIQYADFAHWQRGWLRGEVLDRQLGYWKRQLEAAPTLLALPTDRPRPAVQRHRGAHHAFSIDAGLAASLRELAQRADCTLFMVLLAGFSTVLARYSGQTDICVGSPIANRNRAETEGLIGFFVNTLVMRTRLDDDPTVMTLLGRAREVAMGAYAHQDLPFEQLLDALKPERNLSHAPLFQVSLALQNAPQGSLALPGLTLVPGEGEALSAKFDLTLFVTETSHGLAAHFEYDTDLFDAATMARMAGHLTMLLRAMCETPERAVSELPMLAESERAQLASWNATAAPYDARPVHAQFEAWADLAPDATALRFEGGTLNYAELEARANRLAHHLIALGVSPDQLVGVCMERSPEMVVALLAILKAGAAYVPLDPYYPAERLAFMLNDSGVRLVLTQAHLVERLGGEVSCEVVTADGFDMHPASRPGVHVGPRHAAYMIYTSGSTGRPKGAINSHEALSNRLDWMQKAYGLTPADRVLQKTPFSFDVSVWEFFWPLMTGACLVVARPQGHMDRDYLAGLIRAEGITTLHFVPSMLKVFLDAEDASRCTSLRRVICSGEALGADLQARFFGVFSDHGVELHNLYGPTEAAIDVTAWACLPDADASSVPIGGPISNLRIHILDAGLQQVPVGVAGELYIAGIGLARGYHRRAGLTAERFLPDPFASEADARMYRSGDLARWRADGAIEYLGRADHQVKLRGFRIELGEIESALATHACVLETAVLAREDVPGDRRLVAYIVPQAGGVSEDSLREHVRARLPDYMIPSAFVMLERLPLSPNGKLDRKALPAPDSKRGDEGFIAPRSETEIALAALWAELLQIDRVGAQDNFFALGGHSLLAVTLIERMRQLGWRLDVRSVFVSPTLAELAAAADGGAAATDFVVPPNRIPSACARITPDMLPLIALRQDEIDRTVASVPGGAPMVQDIYPLAPLQEGILFHHRMNPDGDAYVLSSLLAFPSRDALDRALDGLQAVVARHDILRTGIVWEGMSEPVQVVRREARVPVEEVVLDPVRGDVAEQLRTRFDARRFRFDLAAAPLIRAFVAEDAAQGRWLLQLLHHHLIDDNTSLQTVQREIHAHVRGEADRLPPPLPFRDFVAQARSVPQAEHEAFFRRMLGEVDEPTAPFGLLDVQGDGSGLRQTERTLDADLVCRLRTQARRLGVGVATLNHLAWALLLARATGRGDVVFGTVLFGRMQGGEAVDRVLGPFVNTLPMRLDLRSGSVLEALRATQSLLGELLRHEHAPLALAQGCSAVPTGTPLFSALLNCRKVASAEAMSGTNAAGQGGAAELHSDERTNYPLLLSVDDLGDAIVLKPQVQAPTTPELIADLMETALAQLADALEHAPGRPVAELDALPGALRHQILETWNATTAEYPPETTVHARIARQARLTPDAIAARHGDEALSYRELDARATRLALSLRARGVGPEVPVAVCLERSLDMLVGVLAVLKAGGAYVPLDPAYPRERLAYMVEDAQPALLLTQSSLRDEMRLEARDVLCVDADRAEIAVLRGEPPERATRDNLAYVIYTSGSTGRPKGVQITHGSVINFLKSMAKLPGMSAQDRLLAVTPLSFDIAGLELYLPLTVGAEVVIASRDEAADAAALDAAIARHGITVMQATPATWRMWLESGKTAGLNGLRVLCGGEALPLPLAEALQAAGARIFNVYGPTETTIWSTCHALEQETLASVSIGRPIANTRCYVLDANLNPLPAGVVGELYIAGDGLARGYFNRPDLSAEKFLPDPHGMAAGGRMYRTGDKARWLPDGRLDFLGRADFQVKIRGFRIELGEIESNLLRHAAVKEAAVVAREDRPGDQRLVAYVVPRAPDEASVDRDALQHEQVAQWQAIYDESYAQTNDDADPLQNFGIWNSSYDGQAIPRHEMREWADNTVARILALKPRRVLEIGCGTGLLLFRLAPHCQAYCGTDFSPQALDYVRRHLGPEHRHISLREQAAHDFSGFAPGDYDLVVINSVAQYFPDGAYLRSVVDGALGVVAPAGRVFLGDIRNLRLHEAFQAGIELHRAAPELPARQIAEGVRKQVAIENELLVDPAFFSDLPRHEPRVRRVDLVLKREANDNELSRHRYDVVLHCGTTAAPRAVDWLHWHDAGLSLERLRELLADKPPALCLAGVPNARTLREARVAELLRAPEGHTAASLRAALQDADGIEPARLQALAAELGYGFQASWARSDGRGSYLAIFMARGTAFQPDVSVLPDAAAEALTNQPLRNQLGARLPAELARHLRASLPDYMLPSHYVFLDGMPLTPNGKLDRKALPHPEAGARERGQDFTAPRDETETLLAAIWREVLKLEAVGVHDNFFELGGHSLLATRVVSRIREQLSIELPLRRFFETPTVERLAVALREASAGEAPPPILARERGADFPLSFAQQRLWYLAQLEPDNPFYNLPLVIRHTGPLDVGVLRAALNFMVVRHEPLRTVFPLVGEGPVQRILDAAECPFSRIDLTGEAAETREEIAARRVREEIRRPFRLEQELPLRACAIELDPETRLIVVTLHHIVCDGWSGALIGHEFGLIHHALARGEAPALPPLTLQYADFAHWQRGWLKGPVLDRQLAYWSERLAGAPGTLRLPTDVRRAARVDHLARQTGVMIDAPVLQTLERTARERGATLFMALFAALQAVLSRWSGQDDFVLGTVIAGRNQLGTEGMLGCFMNFLPLRASVAPDATLDALLGDAAATIPDAYAHQDCPFEVLVEHLKPERRPGQNPLFNVALLLQNFGGRGDADGMPENGLSDATTGAGVLDLRFVAQPLADGMRIDCEYRAGLFAEATVVALLDFLRECLATLGRTADTPVAALTMPPALAAQQAAVRERDRPQTLAIAASFTAEPVRDALEFWMRTLERPSEIEFAGYNQIFQSLLDPASLFARNRLGANLALLRPEDWLRFSEASGDPGPRFAEIIARNTAELIDALQAFAARASVPTLLCLCPPSSNVLADQTAREHVREAERQLRETCAGLPGVHLVETATLCEDYAVAAYEDAAADAAGHVPYTEAFFAALGSRLARAVESLRRPPYKVLVLDCDNTLWRGVCAEDGPQGVALDAAHAALQRFAVEQHDAGMVICLASKNVADDVWAVFDARADFPLRREHLADAELHWEAKSLSLRRLAERLGLGLDSFVFLDDNPVECAEVMAACPEVLTVQLPAEPTEWPRLLKHLWAVDRLGVTAEARERTRQYRENAQREVLRGATDDFADFLARLELQVEIAPPRPEDLERVAELTQRTNQFNLSTRRRGAPEIRRLCDEGAIEALSVSVRDRFGDYGLTGVVFHRIEGERCELDTFLLSCRVLGRGVEHAVLRHLAELAQARGARELVLPFVASAKNAPMRDFLLGIAPEQVGTERFRLPLERLRGLAPRAPQSVSPEREDGRGAVPLIDHASLDTMRRIAFQLNSAEAVLDALGSQRRQRATRGELAAARDPIERKLVTAWERVLRVDRIGIHDDFFALGGDSLRGIQLVAHIRAAGLQVTPQQLMSHPTIAQLARVVTRAQALAAEGAEGGTVPLAPRQRWLLELDIPKPDYHNTFLVVPVPPDFDAAFMRRAFLFLCAHHDAIRLRFERTDAGWVQRVAAAQEDGFDTHDLSGLDEVAQRAEMKRIGSAAHAGLDLARGPLLRLLHFHLGADRPGWQLLVAHHIILDGFALQLIAQDLTRLYGQLQRGREMHLPPKTASFQEWAEATAVRAREPRTLAELPYWLSLGESAYAPLPRDHQDGPHDEASARLLTLRLSAAETRALTQGLRHRAAPLTDALTAALSDAIGCWAGRDSVWIELAHHGRDLAEGELDVSRTVGWVTANFPAVLRRAEEGASPERILADTHAQLARIPNHGVGYGLLRYANGDPEIERQLRALPEPEVFFNFLGHMPADEGGQAPVWDFGPHRNPCHARSWLIYCRAMVVGEELSMQFEYSENRHRHETIARLAEACRRFLAALGDTRETDRTDPALEQK